MNKKELYKKIEKELSCIITADERMVSNMANFSALIHESFKHHWVGFYLVDDLNKSLYLGPFQGPLACTYIPYGKGVCGNAWKEEKTLIVSDVHKYPGHIACSSLSNSEIVVPVFKDNKIWAVLDIDSVEFSAFDELDQFYLEIFCNHLSQCTRES